MNMPAEVTEAMTWLPVSATVTTMTTGQDRCNELPCALRNIYLGLVFSAVILLLFSLLCHFW